MIEGLQLFHFLFGNKFFEDYATLFVLNSVENGSVQEDISKTAFDDSSYPMISGGSEIRRGHLYKLLFPEKIIITTF